MMSRGRSELLDCIRAVAIFLVVIFHVVVEYPRDTMGVIGEWFYRYGFLGVDIFFPLSGFLITLYLVRNNDGPAVKVFFLRRIFRIVPLYLVAVTLYFIAREVTGQPSELARGWITYLFLTGWFILFDGRANVPFTITWSLSVEEFAYIIAGLTFLWVKRSPVVVLVGLGLGSAVLRWWLLDQGHPFNMVYYFPLARLDSIFLGSLTAVLLVRGHRGGLVAGLAVALVAMAGLANTGDMAFRILLFPTIAVAVCLCIVLAEGYAKGFTWGPTRAIGAFGFHAYFIYLFHYFVIYGVDMVARAAGVTLGPTALAVPVLIIVTVLAVLSWRLFEYPLIRYGRSLEGRKAPAVAAPPHGQRTSSE